jgi:hypothetical protein
VLVYPAEQMNHVTANALLKTLEEPPGDVRFVLASEAAHQLLPTIRSRCLGHTMVVACARPICLQWLASQGVRPMRARFCAQRAGGLTMRWRWPVQGAARRPGHRCRRRWRGVMSPRWATGRPAQAIAPAKALP